MNLYTRIILRLSLTSIFVIALMIFSVLISNIYSNQFLLILSNSNLQYHLTVFDVNRQSQIDIKLPEYHPSAHLALSEDGRHIFITSNHSNLVWDIFNKDILDLADFAPCPISSFTLFRVNLVELTCIDEKTGKTRLFDIDTHQVYTLPRINSLREYISSNYKHVVTEIYSVRRILIFDMYDNLLHEIRPPDTWQNFIGWESDDAILIQTYNTVDRYTLSTQSRETILTDSDIERVIVSPNRQYLVILTKEWDEFYVFNVVTQILLDFPSTNSYIQNRPVILWSPDSQRFLISDVSKDGKMGYYLINIMRSEVRFIALPDNLATSHIYYGWLSSNWWFVQKHLDTMYIFNVDDDESKFMFGDNPFFVSQWSLLDDWLVLRMQNQVSQESVLSYVNLQTGEVHTIPKSIHISSFLWIR